MGPKTAQRIVLDLKDKPPGVMALGGSITEAMEGPEPGAEVVEPVAAPKAKAKPKTRAPSSASAQADALSALSNLGYGPSEAAAAVAEAAGENPEAGEAALIRAALKLLAPKG